MAPAEYRDLETEGCGRENSMSFTFREISIISLIVDKPGNLRHEVQETENTLVQIHPSLWCC
jgi:hypothetical protein